MTEKTATLTTFRKIVPAALLVLAAGVLVPCLGR